MWFAQTVGLRFGIWDTDWILNEMPPRLFEYWRARYLLEPWDMDKKKAIAEANYKAPEWLTRNGRFLTRSEIVQGYRESRK